MVKDRVRIFKWVQSRSLERAACVQRATKAIRAGCWHDGGVTQHRTSLRIRQRTTSQRRPQRWMQLRPRPRPGPGRRHQCLQWPRRLRRPWSRQPTQQRHQHPSWPRSVPRSHSPCLCNLLRPPLSWALILVPPSRSFVTSPRLLATCRPWTLETLAPIWTKGTRSWATWTAWTPIGRVRRVEKAWTWTLFRQGGGARLVGCTAFF